MAPHLADPATKLLDQDGNPIASTRRQPTQRLLTIIFILITLVILSLGAMECFYGNSDSGDVYGSDAVQYLDIARAFGRHDLHSALNPLWSQGYPALLALAHPLFAYGPGGDWLTTRAVNFTIFLADFFAYLFLCFAIIPRRNDEATTRQDLLPWLAAFTLFVATQICLGQVSRVGPDELVNTFFFLACGALIRLLRPTAKRLPLGLLFGVILGLGFLTKAVFLALGCCFLLIAGIALWKRKLSLQPALLAAAIFAIFVGTYGVALSRIVGYHTLGDAGTLNYAWHVDRVPKWVHWEGELPTADVAWPRASIARFAQWNTRPPDFGHPIHPSVILQTSPTVYGFKAPVEASYVPYFDPPYFYQGLHKVVRVRYQIIALFKSLGDITAVFAGHPIFPFAFLAAALLVFWQRKHSTASDFAKPWPLILVAFLGVLLYLPVHLEGRYLSGFLALLFLAPFLTHTSALPSTKVRAVAFILCLGFVSELAIRQLPLWRNVLHHESPHQNVEWQMAEAVLSTGLPARSHVAVIAWTPNLHCDWAYMSHTEIISEIGSGPDFDLFWKQSPAEQQHTINTLRNYGAVAVFVQNKPEGSRSAPWQHLGDTPMWMLKL